MSSDSPPSAADGPTRLLPADTNQARGLAGYARDFLFHAVEPIGPASLALLERFHTDSVGCGVSALAAAANAPTVLRREALATVPAAGSPGVVCPSGPSQRMPRQFANGTPTAPTSAMTPPGAAPPASLVTTTTTPSQLRRRRLPASTAMPRSE